MGDPSFDFWKDHADVFLEMAFRSDRMEPLESPDAEGRNRGDCGDTVTIWLKAEEERIEQVALRIEGCLHTVACANAVAELVEGKPIAQAWKLTVEDVIAFLETLPADHHHCAELAVGALYRALADLQTRRREPWKNPYRRSRAEPGEPSPSGSASA